MKGSPVSKFIGRFIIFIAPVAVIWIYLEINMGALANNYSAKRAFFEKQLDSIEIINLGSSQALYSINPSYIHPKAFNLALLSQTFFYDKRITLKYIDQMPKLKMVILPINYFAFWHQIHDGEEPWRDYYYSYYWGIDYPETHWYDIKKYSAVFLYEPKNVLGIARNNFKSFLLLNMKPDGWVQVDAIGNDTSIADASGLKRATLHNKLINPKRTASIVEDVSSFIEELKKRNIRVVFILTPVCSTYSKYLEPAVVASNDSLLKLLEEKYKISTFNYMNDTSFARTDFFNNDHLNKYGSQKFSKRIQHDIIDPFFRGDSLR